MTEVRYFRTMINGVPVIAAPAEIDITTTDQLRAVLLDAASRGHATVVVDMTRTVSAIPAGFMNCSERTSDPGQKAASCGWSSPVRARFPASSP